MKVREIEELFHQNLHELGERADALNDRVMFVVNRHINYTDICVAKCPLCAFNNREGYLLSPEEILRKVREVDGITEVHIVGGHNPEVGVEYFEEVFRRIKRKKPEVVIKALTATEVYYYAKKGKMSIREFLSRLKDAGLQAMPGGGAEILVDSVRRKISPNKCSSDEWLRVMETAHSLNMPTTATMMFGHVESDGDIVEHLIKIRELQEKTGGFTAFIPWTFQPGNTELYAEIKRPVSPLRYLQVLAISRIVLNNFRNIQASWLTQGFEIATLSLFFGANDFGGTMLEENVVRATGKDFRPAKIEEIVKAVKAVGRPVALRDTYYNILEWF